MSSSLRPARLRLFCAFFILFFLNGHVIQAAQLRSHASAHLGSGSKALASTSTSIEPVTIIATAYTLFMALKKLYDNRKGLDSIISNVMEAAAEAEKAAKLQSEICKDAPDACARGDVQAVLTRVHTVLETSRRQAESYDKTWEGFKWIRSSAYINELKSTLKDIQRATSELVQVQSTLTELLTLETRSLVIEGTAAIKTKLDTLLSSFEQLSSDLILSMAERSVAELEVAALLRRASSADVQSEAIQVKRLVTTFADSLSAQFREMMDEAVSKITAQLTRIEKMVAKQNRRAEYDRYQKEFPASLQKKISASALASMPGTGLAKTQECYDYFSTADPAEFYRDLHMFYMDEQGLYRVPEEAVAEKVTDSFADPLSSPSGLPLLMRKVSVTSQFMLIRSLKALHKACITNECAVWEKRFIIASEFDDFKGMCSILSLPTKADADENALMQAANRWAREKSYKQQEELETIHKQLAFSMAKMATASKRSKDAAAQMEKEREEFDARLAELAKEKAAVQERLRQEEELRRAELERVREEERIASEKRAEEVRIANEKAELARKQREEEQSRLVAETQAQIEKQKRYLLFFYQNCSLFPNAGKSFACCSCKYDAQTGLENANMCSDGKCGTHIYDQSLTPDWHPSVSWLGNVGGFFKAAVPTLNWFNCYCKATLRASNRIDVDDLKAAFKKNAPHYSYEQALAIASTGRA